MDVPMKSYIHSEHARRLGYSSPRGTIVYNIEHLKGFILAIDAKGIRAVRIVHIDGHRSEWFGFPEHAPVTERLGIIDTTKPIRVSVDVRHRIFTTFQSLSV